MEPFPANSGPAENNGFSPADVLVQTAGGVPAVWAPASTLGLDKEADDLDALILWENGNGVYDPSVNLYDWLTGARDMLLFSVRRSSAIIGTKDSNYGVPIEEGDILAPPIGGATAPAIFVPAEALGLVTMRCGLIGSDFADDVDGLATR